jgi:hypothetical protein
MFYRLLGMAVWNGAKALLRYRYGRTYVPKPLLFGAVFAVVGGVALVLARHNGSDT